MVLITRLDVFNKLETLKELDKDAKLVEMTTWANEVMPDNPQMIIDDLESYSNYAQ